ncbi:DNA methyltransferase [Priestia flexa]|nr:DNA methyltransferase [Priestia flexa]WHX78842.1 DNA methyltransferase [Priestia flexa]
MEKVKTIAAKTHPSEYMLHKYWARKPHNVISHFLSTLVPNEGIIVDPFCGSGVTLREASKLGLKSFGFDINPISVLISEVTTNRIDVEEFYTVVKGILDDIAQNNKSYTIMSKTIKYLVHEIIVECHNCNSIVSVSESLKTGRVYKCHECNNSLRFNLENLIKTKITSIVLEGGVIVDNTDLIREQQELSNIYTNNQDLDKYNRLFTENRRILAFKGMTTSRLFTPRNFSLLGAVADRFHKIENEEIRKAALMMLTASVAQCSRLIPYRNNMTTGGPAWSVPGFWVPPQHLETNPLGHLNARLLKVKRGLKEIESNPGKSKVVIEKRDAVSGLSHLRDKGIKADLIFFDPPYGDSVPYTEFSTMWNSFLKDMPNIDTDISVSDRMPKNETWGRYRESLKEILSKISSSLKPEGKLLMTFNNHELRAWEALFGALQLNKFECNFVTYQIPAVISAKAQFSPEGSYNSDIYSVYSVNPDLEPSRSLTPVVDALLKCASSRDGVIAKNLALRVTTVSWMQNNISVELLPERDNLIDSLFEKEDGKLRWKGELDNNTPSLISIAKEKATELLNKGPCDWNDLYEAVASLTVDIGIPDPGELRLALEGFVIFNKKRCMAVRTSTPEPEQLEFPEEIFQ